MTRQACIDRTIEAINQLPEDKAEEISDFVAFDMKRFEENRLTGQIQEITQKNGAKPDQPNK